MTTTNEEYGMEELMALAQAIQEAQKTENENNARVVDPLQIQEKNINEIDLTPRQEEMVEDIADALQNISTMSDKEIKEIYKQLKVQFYADKEQKKDFKKCKKVAKRIVKSDVKYRAVKYIGQLTSVGSLAYGVFQGLSAGGVGMMIWPQGMGQTTMDYVAELVQGNINAYMHLIPEAEALVGAFALGCVLYAGGKYLVKKDEMNKMRKFMVEELSKRMTEEELENFVKALKNNESLKSFVAETEQKQVEDKKAKVDEGMER